MRMSPGASAPRSRTRVVLRGLRRRARRRSGSGGPGDSLAEQDADRRGQGDQRRHAPGGGWRRLRLARLRGYPLRAGMPLSRGQPAEYAERRGEMRVSPAHARPPARRKLLFLAAAEAHRVLQPGAGTHCSVTWAVRSAGDHVAAGQFPAAAAGRAPARCQGFPAESCSRCPRGRPPRSGRGCAARGGARAAPRRSCGSSDGGSPGPWRSWTDEEEPAACRRGPSHQPAGTEMER